MCSFFFLYSIMHTPSSFTMSCHFLPHILLMQTIWSFKDQKTRPKSLSLFSFSKNQSSNVVSQYTWEEAGTSLDDRVDQETEASEFAYSSDWWRVLRFVKSIFLSKVLSPPAWMQLFSFALCLRKERSRQTFTTILEWHWQSAQSRLISRGLVA